MGLRPSSLVIFAALFAIMLMPVRLSVSAPAEIVPVAPYIVSTPLEGVIDQVHVIPNQEVSEGDLLFSLDRTILKNEVDITRKQLAVAQAAYDKTSREAFAESKSKAVLVQLQAEVETYLAQLVYKQDLLKKTEIRAARKGVIIFNDPNVLRGSPIRTGERVMMLASPRDTELQIRVPAKNMIRVNNDVPVKMFLNIAPLKSLRADINMISYEAAPDPDGLITYKVRASFQNEKGRPRIGLEGTARIYGDKSILFYQIFRRPLLTLRRILGL